MKIALVQLDADDNLWRLSAMRNLLQHVEAADLVVFPECMPFDKAIPIAEAEAYLAELTSHNPAHAVIAGGYVLESGMERNAVFLSYRGGILGRYFKRLLWQEPKIANGEEPTLFKWSDKSCIPLICADAADNPSPTGSRMMYEAICLGAGEHVPIVVSSYGAWLNEPYWQVPLQTWARGCGAPLLICGISGHGADFEDGEKPGNYGGGGSGVFWPDERLPWQRHPRCILMIDIKTGLTTSRSIPRNCG